MAAALLRPYPKNEAGMVSMFEMVLIDEVMTRNLGEVHADQRGKKAWMRLN